MFYEAYPCASAGSADWSQHLRIFIFPLLQLEEAERRLHLVVHYGIAYPRLHHLSTGALFPGKAASDQAAEAAEVAAAASASAVVQGPAVSLTVHDTFSWTLCYTS